MSDDDRDPSRRAVLRRAGVAAGALAIGTAGGTSVSGRPSPFDRPCDGPTRTTTRSGSLSGADDSTTLSYDARTGDPCKVVFDLSSADPTDFDLYLTTDGRTPTRNDYDVKSKRPLTSAESVTLDGADVGPDASFGILVDSYTAGGSWTLDVTETETGGGSNQPPTASFSASPGTVPVGEPVQVDATASSDGDGSITSYEWSFGDGTAGAGATTSHAYDSAGTYTITLTVTDDGGATDSASRTVTVESGGNQPPSASATASPTDPSVGGTVRFDGTGSGDPDGSIRSYQWDFGDGTTATGATASHSYSSEGTYAATLTVTDDAGATASDAVEITVGGGGEESPVIESQSVGSSCGYYACDYTVDVAVSDPNGDLASLESRLLTADGQVIDAFSASLSGSNAAGSFTLEGSYYYQPDAIETVVTDADGNTDTDTIS